jgi:hypothetical protein
MPMGKTGVQAIRKIHSVRVTDLLSPGIQRVMNEWENYK